MKINKKLIKELVICLEENNLFNYIPAGIVITGGSANMEGMVKLGEKLTNLKVKLGSQNIIYRKNQTICSSQKIVQFWVSPNFML